MGLSIVSPVYNEFITNYKYLIRSSITDGIIKSAPGMSFDDIVFHLTRTLYYDIYTEYKPYLKKELITQWKSYENF